MASISDVFSRLMAIYLSQFILGVVTSVIFFYFSRSYQRKFLRMWAFSWLAFSLYMLGNFFLTEQLARQDNDRLFTSLMAQMCAFLQIVFLLFGTFELTRNRVIKARYRILIIGLVLSIAVTSILLFNNDPTAFNNRYVLRFGLRNFITAGGFFVSGIIVWINPVFTRGFGQRMLSTFFLLFSTQQFYYVTIVVANLMGHTIDIPSFFGLIDMLLISLIGMSMILWLLEDEREKLRIANMELDNFLYSTSHDLRAPLASILGITNLSKFEVVDADVKNLFTMIEERAKKLDLVIGDILSLARTKKRELEIMKVDFNIILGEVISDIKFAKGAVAIRLVYEEEEDNFLYTDASQLKIILSNLLSNAIKYHNIEQKYPFIKLGFAKKDKRVLISVEDNGQGIARENQSRIFEMFYRASTNSEGTGLGLYIVKEAVTKLGGEISFKSEEKKGTTFLVSFPQQVKNSKISKR